jgi:hypothetical protein
MRNQVAAYLLCAVCAAAPAAAFAQAKAVEFAELVTVFLVPAAAASDQPSWSLGAHPAIRWKSTGPQPASARLAKGGLPLSRTGTVAITVGGRPTHEHDGNRPGQWELTLAGTSAYPAELQIVIDRAAALGFEPAEALRAHGFKVKALCKPGGISSGAAVYTVEAPGHKAVAMWHEWSGGSAGTSAQVKLAYGKSRAAKMQCE